MKLDSNNLEIAIKAAKRRAKLTGETWYAIYEPDHTGTYHAVDDYDLETFYAGISDNSILFCTA